ncbi:MAG: DNA-protecting protein DprA [Clostridiales bacterium]|nr:DNA-protecting protein DprA [Clostridiales bacterium]
MEYTKEQLARIWLQCAPMSGWNKLAKLKERFQSAQGIWDHFTPELFHFLGEPLFAHLADMRMLKCRPYLDMLDQIGGQTMFCGEENYPALLSQISHPPDVLFIRGQLPPPDTPAMAIVGSRSSTRYGSTQARRIARELAERGVTIVSGLARGIDAAAHLGALEGGGRTVAVLGCGLMQQYPPENKELAQRIIQEGGAIVSELAPDAQPLPHHFPVRNRIISGLSHGVLLIEAREKSGTHSTIQYALDQGKEVFALPGNVDAPGSELPLKLLKEGAALCTGAEDILSLMNWKIRPPEQLSFVSDECPKEEEDPILRALSLEEKNLEELLQETGLPIDALSTQLTLLELNGQIERRAGRAFARVRP